MHPPTKVILGLAAFLLVSFVSPFSYLPNPLGLYYIAVGYSYNADSVLVNRFATLIADPAQALSFKLSSLIGKTGLDPLDPNHPLTGFHVRRVVNRPTYWQRFGADIAAVEVELWYADGSRRTYEIPLYQRYSTPDRFPSWRYTGLDRLLAEHRELPHAPFPLAATPARMGKPERLPLSPEAHRLGTGSLIGWYMSEPREGEEVRWAPDGQQFLLKTSPPEADGDLPDHLPLWLVSLDGSPPRKIAEGEVVSYDWSADGKSIVYLRQVRSVSLPMPRFEIVAIDLNTGVIRQLTETDSSAFSVVGSAVNFLDDGALWRQSLDGQAAELLRQLPNAGPAQGMPDALAVSPDGNRVAYRCGSDACVADVSGENLNRIALGYLDVSRVSPTQPEVHPSFPHPAPTALPANTQLAQSARLKTLWLSWNHGGDKLAITTGSLPQGRGNDRAPELLVVDRSGQLERTVTLGPDGTTRAAQWTPDDRFIFVNTFPQGGRRLIVVDVDTGEVLDLSQPRWDAIGSLAPDGRTLLLWNGRGGFWTVLLELHESY